MYRRSNSRATSRASRPTTSLWARLFKPRARAPVFSAPSRTSRAPVFSAPSRTSRAPVRPSYQPYPRGRFGLPLSRKDKAFFSLYGRVPTAQNRQNQRNKNARHNWYEREDPYKHYGQGWY